jgi:hypothetical protein
MSQKQDKEEIDKIFVKDQNTPPREGFIKFEGFPKARAICRFVSDFKGKKVKEDPKMLSYEDLFFLSTKDDARHSSLSFPPSSK